MIAKDHIYRMVKESNSNIQHFIWPIRTCYTFVSTNDHINSCSLSKRPSTITILYMIIGPGRQIMQLCQLRICKLVLRLMKMVFTCPGHCEIISCFNAADKLNKFQTLVKWIVWMTIKISTHGQCIGNAFQTWEENFNIFFVNLFVKPLKAMWLWLLKMNLFKNREAENIFWECDDVSQDKENHPQELFTNTNDSSKPGKESQCFDGHHTLLHQHFLIKLNSDSIVCSSWIWWLPRLFCQISEKLKMLLRRQVTML